MIAARLLLILALLSFAAAAQTESNELGLTLGVERVPNRETQLGAPLTFSRSIVYGANYARRLRGGTVGAFYLEFPLAAVPSHTVRPVGPTSITHLASLFITPSLRVQFAPLFPVSPWVSAGVGYGLYEGSKELANGSPNPDLRRSTAAAQFGGGIDVKTPLRILAPISLRGEFRDFYTFRSPSYNVPLRDQRQHNLVLAGGFVLRF